jgi:sulfate adenylyltransferase subunit 1 (EFTu-like GTPase family)
MENKLNIKEYLDKDEQKDLLRLLTAGSVDDGKSTLIGRLLFDSKKLYEDQLAALERDSKRVGNAGDHIDYALLCDGLKAEREQGITIDVAYRYFSTNNRKFIIADTPGHEQYTRNMITGGSTAKPLFFDSYQKNKACGSFILIDPITNNTSAVGMIIDRVEAKDMLNAMEVPTLNLAAMGIGEEHYRHAPTYLRETRQSHPPKSMSLLAAGKHTLTHHHK